MAVASLLSKYLPTKVEAKTDDREVMLVYASNGTVTDLQLVSASDDADKVRDSSTPTRMSFSMRWFSR